MLKEGDVLTLSAGYPLKIDEFQYLKPHASITRKLSDDIMGDLREMQTELQNALRRALVVCITEVSELVEKLDQVDGDVDDLAELVTKELDDGKVAEIAHVEVEGHDGGHKKPAKKAAKKKGGAGKLAKKKGSKKKKLG